jgi:hypothetical protein
MRVHPRRGVRVVIGVLGVAALLAIVGGGRTATASLSSPGVNLAGTWAGKYAGAYSGTFKLHWTQSGSALIGSITLSNPHGKYPISGRVRGSAISFGAVGAGATYTGTVSGKAMSGKYKTAKGPGTWSAHKTS